MENEKKNVKTLIAFFFPYKLFLTGLLTSTLRALVSIVQYKINCVPKIIAEVKALLL